MAFDVAKIEERIDRAVTAGTEITMKAGPIRFQNFGEVMEFAKAMSTADVAVPAYLRGNPGACLRICNQALEWDMSPWSVADQSYVANDRVAYQSQLIHAIVEARAPLKGRLRHEILGEGDERRCRVYGTFKGENDPHVFISETLATMRGARGTNDRGQIKGSPLWQTQPDTQLYYSATRTWARMFCPDVILGIYAADELPDGPTDVTPPPPQENPLIQRLKERKLATVRRKQRGFNEDHVNHHADKLGGVIIEGHSEDKEEAAEAEPAAASMVGPEPEQKDQA